MFDQHIFTKYIIELAHLLGNDCQFNIDLESGSILIIQLLISVCLNASDKLHQICFVSTGSEHGKVPYLSDTISQGDGFHWSVC